MPLISILSGSQKSARHAVGLEMTLPGPPDPSLLGDSLGIGVVGSLTPVMYVALPSPPGPPAFTSSIGLPLKVIPVPVPENGIWGSTPEALLATSTKPDRAPSAAGVNATRTKHCPPGATGVVQRSVNT